RPSSARATASAMGERQVLPVQTNRMLYVVAEASTPDSFAMTPLPPGFRRPARGSRDAARNDLRIGEIGRLRDLQIVAISLDREHGKCESFTQRRVVGSVPPLGARTLVRLAQHREWKSL